MTILVNLDLAGAVCLMASSGRSKSTGEDPVPSPPRSSAAVCLGGQSYETVTIGSQTWMAENLAYAGNTGTLGACFNDDADSCAKYGRLYTWAQAMNLPDSCDSRSCASQVQPKYQGICPTGWHVPDDAEWTLLVNATGGDSVAATGLKSKAGWSKEGNGTDLYGFSAMPAGYLYSEGAFVNVGVYANFWSTSESAKYEVWYRYLGSSSAVVTRSTGRKSIGFSVRCLED
ncbi:MAG: fibrobacter succinogenes major paralogous domain-containing protein [Fibrobacteria bacterium]|nr:fibrobacter succinogenes major paralogous domain-containing protein [Fibrobacteria bacterium]